MNPITRGAPLTDAGRDRLDRIKKAIADGTYHVSSYDVAVTLIQSTLEFDDAPPLHKPSNSSDCEMEVQPLDQTRG